MSKRLDIKTNLQELMSLYHNQIALFSKGISSHQRLELLTRKDQPPEALLQFHPLTKSILMLKIIFVSNSQFQNFAVQLEQEKDESN